MGHCKIRGSHKAVCWYSQLTQPVHGALPVQRVSTRTAHHCLCALCDLAAVSCSQHCQRPTDTAPQPRHMAPPHLLVVRAGRCGRVKGDVRARGGLNDVPMDGADRGCLELIPVRGPAAQASRARHVSCSRMDSAVSQMPCRQPARDWMPCVRVRVHAVQLRCIRTRHDHSSPLKRHSRRSSRRASVLPAGANRTNALQLFSSRRLRICHGKPIICHAAAVWSAGGRAARAWSALQSSRTGAIRRADAHPVSAGSTSHGAATVERGLGVSRCSRPRLEVQ